MHATRTTVGLALLVGLALTLGIGRFAAAEWPAAAMSAEGTRQTVTAYAEAVLGNDAYETFFADDIVVTMADTGQQTKGAAAAKQAIDGLHRAAFDAAPVLAGLVAGEGEAALEWRLVGTHTGEFAGFAPTGQEIDVSYGAFVELRDGKITALRLYGLTDGLLHQLREAAR